MEIKIKHKNGFKIIEYWCNTFPFGWKKFEIKEHTWFNPYWNYSNQWNEDIIHKL